MTQLKICHKSFHHRRQNYTTIDINAYIGQDWIEKLNEICTTHHYSDLNTDLTKHLGANSTYHHQQKLCSSIQFIYAILSDQLAQAYPVFQVSSDQKKAIIDKFSEGIQTCTPGFHSRVESILLSFSNPKNLEELLTNLRYDLVEKTAIQASSEVHTNNRFFIVAKRLGYGVEPKLPEDPYRGHLNDEDITERLQTTFTTHYQFFSLLHLLQELLKAYFIDYSGRKSAPGYAQYVYEPALELLKNLLQREEHNLEFLDSDPDSYMVYDFNWPLITSQLLQKLQQEQFIRNYTFKNPLLQHRIIEWGLGMVGLHDKTGHALFTNLPEKIADPSTFTLQDIQKICTQMHPSFQEHIAFLKLVPTLHEPLKLSVIFHLEVSILDDVDNEIPLWKYFFENITDRERFKTEYLQKDPQFTSKIGPRLEKIAHHLKIQCIRESQHKTDHDKLLIGYFNFCQLTTIQDFLKQYAGLLVKIYNGHPDTLTLFFNYFNFMSHEQAYAILFKPYSMLPVLCSKKNQNALIEQCLSIIKAYSQPDEIKYALDLPQTCPRLLKHYPQYLPTILNYLTTLYSIEEQQHISQNICDDYTNVLKQHPAIQLLFELNLKITSTTNHFAVTVAQTLQTQLIQALDFLYSHAQPTPSIIEKFQTSWTKACYTAQHQLSYYQDFWSIIKNLFLIAASIPLLGLPMYLNHRYTQHYFFKPTLYQKIENCAQITVLPPY